VAVKKMAFPQNTPKNFPVFSSFFAELEDPRRTSQGNHLYPLDEILFLSIAAVISGADTWTSIGLFGKAKLEWLRKFFPFENGIPSHDVLGKVFASLDSGQFSTCFVSWIDSLAQLTAGEIIAIDGKTLCGSDDKARGKSALHVVSAFASANSLCLGQVAVDSKSNEITAIPQLLDLLALKGCIVTLDAMGCQKSIAQAIQGKEADYVLTVKGNQKELKSQIDKLFSIAPIKGEFTGWDAGHGRFEQRKCEVVDQLDFLDDRHQWPGLKTVVRLTSERTIKQTGKQTSETSYYITSLAPDPQAICQAIRSHWAVENKLHWSLDVIFKEDASLKKRDHSALNFNIISKMALSLLEQEKSSKKSKPSKRLLAALDDDYRAKVLNI
jgi:predicted transposase YbfD/YdcC